MNITAKQLALYLNEIFELDPGAIHSLITTRVPCNDSLLDHPTVQCLQTATIQGNYGSVGFLGILNGMLSDGPWLCTQWSDEEDEFGRKTFLGFGWTE